MLVVDPAKRISISQIKQHRWMLADPSAPHQTLSHSLTDYNSNLGDYSEPVLSIMHTLGIDRQRTVEVSDDKSEEHGHTLLRIMAQVAALTDQRSAVTLNRHRFRDSACQFCGTNSDGGNLVFILASCQDIKYVSLLAQSR